jgi:uncharacterized protein involved in exopolysaccharide biosynthesis
MAEEGPWLSLKEAAQRSGLAREAIRARTRRKLIPSQKGNRGELLVQLPADLLAGDVQGMADPVADLLAEVADLREQLARTEAEREAARAVATAEVAAAKTGAMAEVAAKEELIQELRKMLGSLRAELVEARRPWWRRFIGK